MRKICWFVFSLIFCQNVFSQCLNGSYTVGSGCNYTTLQDAVNDLNSKGSCGPVEFKVKQGIYLGKVVFPASLNLSSTKPLTVSGAKYSITRFYDNPSNSATNNYVIKIDGAKYITFRDLQIDRGSGGETYANVISLTNNVSNIHFENCKISGIKTSSGGGINKVLMHFDTTFHQNITIKSCILNGGGNGIYYARTGTANNAGGWVIQDNSFTDVTETSIYLTRLKNLKILKNKIQATLTSIAFQWAINLSDCGDSIEIKRNTVIQNRGTVFSLNNTSAGNNAPVEIYNNVFNSVGSNSAAVVINASSNVWFYHNSVKQSSSGSAIICTQNKRLKIANNIVQGGVFSLSIDSISSVLTSNFNNWISTSGQGRFKRNTDTFKSVAAWTTYSGFDNSSISQNVYFSSNELDVSGENVFLNNKGTFLSEVSEDIWGKSRSNSKPDIGAYEFDVFGTNVSFASSQFNVLSSICPGNQEVKVKIINKGFDTIKSVTIKVRIGNHNKTVFWSGILASFDTSAFITVDTFDFQREQEYTLEYTLEKPNGKVNGNNTNNTVVTSGIKTKMTGDYTVSGVKGFFANLDDALTAIKSRGFCDTVRLKLRNGRHDGNWDLSGIKQKFSTDFLIIESEYQDPQRCTLHLNSGVGSQVLRFAGASGIIIRNLSIGKIDNAGESTLIRFESFSNKNIIIEGNTLIGSQQNPVYLGSSIKSSLIVSNTSSNNTRNDSIQIIRNIFRNNDGGVYFRRTSSSQPESGLIIRDNKFTNQVYEAILLQNHQGAIITGNQIETLRDTFNKTSGPWPAVKITESKDFVIEKNYIYRANGSALRMEKDSGKSIQSVVKNNVLVSQTPLVITQSKNIGYYFNTIRSIGDSTKLAVLTSAVRQIQLNNNIVYHENKGRLYDSLNINFLAANNVYYTTNKRLTISDTSLAQINSRGLDSGSIFHKPLFLSLKDCHIYPDSVLYAFGKDSIGITVDKDNKLRDTLLTPGAYETVKSSSADVGITRITPEISCGYKPFITADIKNYSLSDTLYNVLIGLTINNNNFDSVLWQGKIAPGDTVKNVLVKRHVFDYDSLYTIKVWTTLPNSTPDINILNDSLVVAPSYYRLSGKYYVDGFNPDFYNPREAINALYKSGVCGDVILELRKNRYLDTLKMDGMVKGMGNEHWITIKGESTDSTDVEISYNYLYTPQFTLKDIKHIKISNLTLTTGASFTSGGQASLNFINSIGTNIVERVWFGGITILNGDSIKICKSFFSEGSSIRAEGCSNLVIDSSDFYGGSAAFKNGKHTTFTNNVVFYNDSIYLNNEEDYRISNNYCFGLGVDASMVFEKCLSGEIANNRFFISGGGGGNLGMIYFYYTNGTLQKPITVKNNILYTNDFSRKMIGILISESSFIDILHNTIMLDSGANKTYESINLETKWSKNIKVANNLFVKRTAPFPEFTEEFVIRTDSFNAFRYFDHNYYSVNDSLPHEFTYFNSASNRISFKKWQDTSGFDVNSKWGKMPAFFLAKTAFIEIIKNRRPSYWSSPYFKNKVFYETFPYLNQNYNWTEKSSYNTGPDKDIFGNYRDTAHPNFGAEEYLPQKVNAGLVGFDFPADNPCQGSNDVRVKLSNFGIDTLKSILIKGKIRDSVINYYWTGKLSQGDTIALLLSTHTILRHDSLDIILWTESPNNQADEYTTFDTIKGYYYPSMSGTYTMGGVTPDYKDFQTFVDDLKRRGVCGPVTLEVRSGNYEGQYVLPTISGSSEINTITVISSARDSSFVTFSYSGFMNGYNVYVLHLNNAKHWKFKHVSFFNTQTATYSRVILMNKYVTDIEFYHCSFKAVTRGTEWRNSLMQIAPQSTIYSDEEERIGVVEVRGCFFDGATYGIYGKIGAWGNVDTGTTRLIIDSCVFFDQLTSVEILFPRNLTISNSIFYGKPKTAIQLLNTRDSLSIFNNRILDAMVTAITIGYTAEKGVQRIYNNEIVVKNPYGASSPIGALRFDQIDGLEFVSNSVNQQIPDDYYVTTYVSPWMIYITSPTSLIFRNNLLTNKPGGKIIFADNAPAGSINSDYNIWDAKDTLAMYNQKFIIGHNAWKAQTGNDSNTIIDNIIYPDSTPLRYSNLNLKDKGVSLSYVMDDINGTLRTSTPDIGCYEDGVAANISVDSLSPEVTCRDTVMLKARLKNKGTTPISFFEYEWTQNGVSKGKGAAKLSIAPGDSVDWGVGNVVTGKTSNTFKLKVTSVNYQQDLDTTNNTNQITMTFGTPKAHSLPAQKTGCENDTVSLDPGLFARYQWSTGDTTRIIKVAQGSRIYFTLTDLSGCLNNDSIEISFEKGVDLGNDTTRCDTNLFIIQSSGFNSYNWSTGAKGQSITVNRSGNYWVKVTSLSGCASADTVLVNLSVKKPILKNSNDTLFITNYDINNTYSWLLNDTLIAGVTDSFYKAVKKGTYTVNATDNNGVCVSKSSQTFISLLIRQDNQALLCNVYPNPNNGVFTIELVGDRVQNEEVLLTVVDLLGRELYTKEIKDGISQINLQHLNTGVYHLILSNKSVRGDVKIIITR